MVERLHLGRAQPGHRCKGHDGDRPHRGQFRPPPPDQPISAEPAQPTARPAILGGLLNEIPASQVEAQLRPRVQSSGTRQAEYHDLSLGDLLEGIVLHAFERSCPFDEASVAVIDQLKRVYGLDLTAADSHQLISPDEEQP